MVPWLSSLPVWLETDSIAVCSDSVNWLFWLGHVTAILFSCWQEGEIAIVLLAFLTVIILATCMLQLQCNVMCKSTTAENCYNEINPHGQAEGHLFYDIDPNAAY